MNRIVFAATFAVGLLTVAWVGVGFAGVNGLALVMTAVIAAVYLLGAFELRQFRAATASLSAALAEVPQPLNDTGTWLARVPASLQNPVRLRIEGERVALPGPALTPYLVGLLVMLGMLGTFLGMIVTFKGAVFALEGSTDLQAIRSALAAPIKGLGLSFGTSVAGVAASAMLGLLSALSRRERLDVARQLDSLVATVFRPFSLGHQRQQAFKALEVQAQALPQVVDRLQAMMEGLEHRSQQLDAQLLARQDQFHRDVGVAYTGLADSVGASLKDSLTAGAKAAGDSIAPVVQAAMAEISESSRRTHQQVFETTQAQLNGLSDAFGATARSVSDGWNTALQNHAATSVTQAEHLDRTLTGFSQTFERRAADLLAAVERQATQAQATRTAGDEARLQAWTQSLASMATGLQDEWRAIGAGHLAQQQVAWATLQKTMDDISDRASQQAGRTLGDTARLLAQSETLIASRIDAEAGWVQQHGERMDQLASLWRSELGALRNEEAARGEAAVQRLGALQAALGTQLATLGTALEAPMTRLMQTAAEVPEAAAGVIAQLRQEMARLSERDQRALEERATLVERLGQTFEQRSADLIAAVEQHAAQAQATRTAGDEARLQTWTQSLASMATGLQNEWRQVGAGHLAQQQTAWAVLEQTLADITERAGQQAGRTLDDTAKLLTQSEALIQSRIEAEAGWVQQHGERMDQLAGLWRSELGALRSEEATRGQAAVDRLGELQVALAGHLATLGTALEAPMTRLMQTAAEVPQAAAGVITQLRQEMARLSERDNQALEERAVMGEKIAALLQTLNQASGEQRAAIESLVASATTVLDQSASRFAATLEAQAGTATEVATQVGGSAIELASLGEAFQHGVTLFSSSNEKLMDGLQRMEAALGQSAARSDEQLAYYVAQAREVIDLSMSSQQQIVEDLRRLRSAPVAVAEGSAE